MMNCHHMSWLFLNFTAQVTLRPQLATITILLGPRFFNGLSLQTSWPTDSRTGEDRSIVKECLLGEKLTFWMLTKIKCVSLPMKLFQNGTRGVKHVSSRSSKLVEHGKVWSAGESVQVGWLSETQRAKPLSPPGRNGVGRLVLHFCGHRQISSRWDTYRLMMVMISSSASSWLNPTLCGWCLTERP